MANTISVNVVADVKNISKGIDSVNNQLTGFNKSVGKIGGGMKAMFGGAVALAGGAGIVSTLKSVVGGASDLNETISKTQAIFGKSSAGIESWAGGAAKSMGLSKQAALDGASTFGNFFNQIGIGAKQTEQMSKGFVQAAVDLGSFHNAAPTDVMEALSAATRGEYDSLQKYIPTINAAAVEQQALAMTHKKTAKELTNADKALAVNAIVMKGQGKAAGDFAKTQGSLANQTKIAKAQFDNMKTTVGTYLLPLFTKLATWVTTDGIPRLKELGTFIQTTVLPKIKEFGTFLSGTIIPALQSFGSFLASNRAILEPLGVAILAIVAAIKVWSIVTKAYTAVQLALNIVMSANPIGLLVLAIVGLVAAFIYLWKTNDGFRNAVIKAWTTIKSAASSVFGWLKSFISGAFSFIKNAFTKYTPLGIILSHFGQIRSFITGAINGAKGAFSAAWNAMKSSVSSVLSGIKSAVTGGINNVVSTIKGIKGRITGIFSGAVGWLASAGRNILQGLLNGIQDMIGKIRNKLQEVTNLIPDWKGPADVDKKLLYNAGQLIMGGLIKGIDKKKSALRQELKSVTGIINGTNMGSLAFADGAGINGMGTNVTIEVNVPVGANPAETGRQVAQALDAYYAQGGRRKA